MTELERLEGLNNRWDKLRKRDIGMPAFRQLHADVEGSGRYFRDNILRESDHALAESRLAAIEAKDVLLVIDLNANAYRQKRRNAYASVGDQLDMMYKDKINGTSTWVDHVSGVKLLHAKP